MTGWTRLQLVAPVKLDRLLTSVARWKEWAHERGLGARGSEGAAQERRGRAGPEAGQAARASQTQSGEVGAVPETTAQGVVTTGYPSTHQQVSGRGAVR